MSIDKRGPKLGDAASLYVLLGWVDCVHTRPLLLLLLRRLFPPGNAPCLWKYWWNNSFYPMKEWKMFMERMDHTWNDMIVQVEFHTVSWMDQGGSPDVEIMSHEVWCWKVGADFRYWSAAWEADSAVEWPDAEVVGTTESCCIHGVAGGYWSYSAGQWG